MRVHEARALVRRIAGDKPAVDEALEEALGLFKNGLIVPHSMHEDNEIYAGPGAGNVALQVEQALADAQRALGVLKRSVEVAAAEIYKARKEAPGNEHLKRS